MCEKNLIDDLLVGESCFSENPSRKFIQECPTSHNEGCVNQMKATWKYDGSQTTVFSRQCVGSVIEKSETLKRTF